MTTKEDRLIGPPGTGKTTTLSQAIAYHAKRVGSEAVVAISHTRAAAAELAGRKTPLPRDNIATLHALAYRALDRPKVAEDSEHLCEFSQAYPHWRMAASMDEEDLAFHTAGAPGDCLLADYSRLRNLTLPRELWPPETASFAKAWERYKVDTATIDFTDMIELAADNTECAPQDPAVIVLDEAQDTSRLQWKLLQRWTRSCEQFITAGDPDQSIFEFNGADPAWFLENRPDRQRVLEQSYRVPIAVHKLAMAWIAQVRMREQITYLPRDYPGTVARNTATIRYVDPLLPVIEQHLDNGKTVMVMATCGYMLTELLSTLRRLAIPFANPWRRKRGDWNPLYQRKGNSTVGGIRAFLAPQLEGRTWTAKEARDWAHIVKGVFKRGAKQQLLQYLQSRSDDDIDQVAEDIIAALADEDDFSRMLAEDNIDWLEEHLLASKVSAAEFPLHIARKRGPRALSEEPRLFIGTCHSFKGAEADVVITFPDLSAQGYTQWLTGQRDSIVRLFYVAFTRAREELILCSAASGASVW